MASMKNTPLTAAGADLGIGAGSMAMQQGAVDETEEERKKRLALIDRHGMAAAMLLGGEQNG